MRRLFRPSFKIALLLGGMVPLGACSAESQVPADRAEASGTKPVGSASSSPSSPPKVPSPPVPAQGRSIAEEDGALSFKFAYPPQAAAQPALKDRLEAEIAATRKEWRALAREHAARRAELGLENLGLFYDGTYEVVADLPAFLSLSFAASTYGGGAHGNLNTGALIWDKRLDREVTLRDMFGGELGDAVRTPFCRKLNAERERRRGQPVGRNLEDSFNACPELEELTVLVGSSDGKIFDRMTLIADPYVAGPYAEGSFAIDLPVTPAVRAVVAPKFKPAFGI